MEKFDPHGQISFIRILILIAIFCVLKKKTKLKLHIIIYRYNLKARNKTSGHFSFLIKIRHTYMSSIIYIHVKYNLKAKKLNILLLKKCLASDLT